MLNKCELLILANLIFEGPFIIYILYQFTVLNILLTKTNVFLLRTNNKKKKKTFQTLLLFFYCSIIHVKVIIFFHLIYFMKIF